MANDSRPVRATSDIEQPTADSTRRNLALALLGALGGSAFFEACAGGEEPNLPPDVLGHVSQAVTGTLTSAQWTDSIGLEPEEDTLNFNLRNLAGGWGQVVLVQGFGSPGDGGGGVFFWDITARTDDGGTIIVPGTSASQHGHGACWRRIYSGPLNGNRPGMDAC
jgi:hypothetical protein